MFEKQLVAWMAWRVRSDFKEASRVGYKPTTIEYRVMAEAGIVEISSSGVYDFSFIERIDIAWKLLRVSHPEYMVAVELYYLYNRKYRPGRMRMGVSQAKYRRLVSDGTLMLLGATYVVEN